MSDIFINYANEDRERAEVLAAALTDQGWSVFWDRTIPPGLTWREFIGKELEEASCVLVAWSEVSVKSEWVLEEALSGKKRKILIPVLFETVPPPSVSLDFRPLIFRAGRETPTRHRFDALPGAWSGSWGLHRSGSRRSNSEPS